MNSPRLGTYAEVTPEGPRLLAWTPAGGVPVTALPATT